MHVVATNIILWLRTLVKESLEEIAEIEEEHKREQEHMHDAERIHHSVNIFQIFFRCIKNCLLYNLQFDKSDQIYGWIQTVPRIYCSISTSIRVDLAT